MTTETKFTPGPWVLEDNPTVNGQQVAAFEKTGDMAGNRCLQVIVRSNNAADASLIAAAPELLAALQKCAESMRDAFPDFDHFERPAYKAAVDAIAKATGGEEGEKGDD